MCALGGVAVAMCMLEKRIESWCAGAILDFRLQGLIVDATHFSKIVWISLLCVFVSSSN